MKKEKINSKVLRLTELSVLLAIIILMAFTPIGYLKAGVVEITFITIPVIVGAVILDEKAGALLGLAFGITSFLQGILGLSAFGIALIEVSPLYAFLVTVPTRVLMGFLTGVIFKAIKKDKLWSYGVSGLCGSLLNTLLFMTTLILLYWKTDYIQGIKAALGSTNIFAFVLAFVGVNGAIEAACCTVIAAVLCKALKSVRR